MTFNQLKYGSIESVKYSDGQRTVLSFIKLFNDNQIVEKQLDEWSLYAHLNDENPFV